MFYNIKKITQFQATLVKSGLSYGKFIKMDCDPKADQTMSASTIKLPYLNKIKSKGRDQNTRIEM